MLNDKVIADIKKVFPFVNELGDKEDQFFNMLYHKKLGPDMVLLDEDKSCSGVVLVLSGTIRIYKLSEDGKEITLFRIGRGETCVLTIACIMGTGDIPFPVAAATEQASEIVLIPVETFKKCFYEIPAIQKFFFTSMSAKFYSLLGLVENITFKRTSDRLTDFLITKTAGGAYPLYATHENIASEIGTAREVVSRLLKEMEGKGQVSLSRGKIIYNQKKTTPSSATSGTIS
ncbi:MAG: Crp/Fnr family transcriptional regulator [Acetivibrionales bacterium]|jgi:CRP/FNR family transcriptional regulator|nr:Crp/Fnr family transcriptional regulator [Clostridiaceae bacterium]